MRNIHEVNGYGIRLSLVQNYYPVEEDAGIWCWGFKYISGIFEFFYYADKDKAGESRANFIIDFDNYLESIKVL